VIRSVVSAVLAGCFAIVTVAGTAMSASAEYHLGAKSMAHGHVPCDQHGSSPAGRHCASHLCCRHHLAALGDLPRLPAGAAVEGLRESLFLVGVVHRSAPHALPFAQPPPPAPPIS
jgi:hypothetical protein